MTRKLNLADLVRRKLASDADLASMVEQEAFNAHIASQIYELRLASGLTQTQLAERVGTTQSVIARLEDADYEGHSLSMLKRIADALGVRLRVEFYSKCEFVEATAATPTEIPIAAEMTFRGIEWSAVEDPTNALCHADTLD